MLRPGLAIRSSRPPLLASSHPQFLPLSPDLTPSFSSSPQVTGDANVPAGSVSFRAKVGRKHRLDARDVYPDELGIVARCERVCGGGGAGRQAWEQEGEDVCRTHGLIQSILVHCCDASLSSPLPRSSLVPHRFKGEGRVANKAFTQPRWVEGELLVFNSKGGPLTGGAQLGFVWAVPGEKRFLILLSRVELSDVCAAKHH